MANRGAKPQEYNPEEQTTFYILYSKFFSTIIFIASYPLPKFGIYTIYNTYKMEPNIFFHI